MKRTKHWWVASLVLLVAQGCAPAASDTRGDYLAGLAILASTPSGVPTPAPAPDGDCDSCGGQGWLGDGRVKFDCPDCDIPWDASAASLPAETPSAPTPPDQSTPKDSALTHDAAGPVGGVVVVEPRKRVTYLSLPTCGTCRQWERRVLNDPLVQAELAAWWDYQGKVNANAVSPRPDRVPKVRIIDPVAGSIIDLVPASDAVAFVQQLKGLR